MIARSPDSGQAAWQTALLASARDVDSLFGRLALDPAQLPGAQAAAARFPCRITPEMLDTATRGGADPVLRQFLPAAAELEEVPGFVADPVGDRAAARAPGLLQKYAGRALLVTTAACAVHCRYCFRRHFPYAEQTAARDGWRGALAQLAASPDVAEVILSGGDPLMLSDERLAVLWEGLATIPHVVRLRVHTRMPTVLPERVTPALLELLRRPRFASSVVVHVNHTAELTPAAVAALRALRATGAALLNQSVLLRGVNDDVDVLTPSLAQPTSQSTRPSAAACWPKCAVGCPATSYRAWSARPRVIPARCPWRAERRKSPDARQHSRFPAVRRPAYD